MQHIYSILKDYLNLKVMLLWNSSASYVENLGPNSSEKKKWPHLYRHGTFRHSPSRVFSIGMFSMYIPFSCFTYFQSHFTFTVQRTSSTSLASASYGIDVWVDVSSPRIHTQTHCFRICLLCKKNPVMIATSSVNCQKRDDSSHCYPGTFTVSEFCPLLSFC